MMRDLYANNYPQRRLEVLLHAAGRCEHTINGQRCPNQVGAFKISRSYQPYFERLYIHHVNGDPENPDAEMIAVCASCHMKLHRRPGESGKTPSRKQGYTVVSINHLLYRLAAVGFTVVPNEQCRVNWSIGPFAAEAADPIDALAMALHWLSAEVSDLEAERAELKRTQELATTQRSAHHV